MVELVSGGSVINGAYPVLFSPLTPLIINIWGEKKCFETPPPQLDTQ